MAWRTLAKSVRTGLDVVTCPECGHPAEVEWSESVTSTDGPVELVKIRCLDRHLFLMERARLP